MAVKADDSQTSLSQGVDRNTSLARVTGVRNKSRHRQPPDFEEYTSFSNRVAGLGTAESQKRFAPQDESAIADIELAAVRSAIAAKSTKKQRSSIAAQATSAGLRRTLSNSQSPAPTLSLRSSIENSMSAPAPLRPVSLLIASLGNPPPYHSTRHSAAHIVLQHLQSSLELPPLRQKSKAFGGGHVSEGDHVGRPEITLYQSAVLMNISGPPLLKAWRHFCGIQDIAGRTPGLVVLHDEMEIEPGRLKVRRAQNSIKGHNGLKSVQSSLSSAGTLGPPGNKYLKIGIGIGRPVGGSRQSDDVSAYVLGQLTSKEKEGLQQCVGELAMTLYREMEKMSKT